MSQHICATNEGVGCLATSDPNGRSANEILEYCGKNITTFIYSEKAICLARGNYRLIRVNADYLVKSKTITELYSREQQFPDRINYMYFMYCLFLYYKFSLHDQQRNLNSFQVHNCDFRCTNDYL